MLSTRTIVIRVIALIWLTCVRIEPARAQQQLGYKLLGGTGIDAGVQAEPGLYIAGRVIRFTSSQLRNGQGDVVPLPGLNIDARGLALGVAYTMKSGGAPYLTFAVSAPAAKLSLTIDDPRVAIDPSGFGDMYFVPLKMGWRWPRFDGVASYSLYAPTGKFEPRSGSGIGRGFWTQQFSLGGAAFFNESKTSRASALVSYDRNGRKRGIDITRGNTVQVQGGAGLGVSRIGTVGVAGYALWQVTDDRGSDIPPAVRGQSGRVFGLGPEVRFVIPKLKLSAELRMEFDFGVRSRPDGTVIAGGLTYVAWQPKKSPK
jgi:hypothetical protein